MKRSNESATLVRCPSCGQLWPETYARCPDDGTALNEATVLAYAPAPSTPIKSSVGATTPGPAKQIHVGLVPGTVIDSYQIEGKLGEGAMGEVYAAIHPVLGKRVAIKVINPRLSADAAAVERFMQEARAVAQLGHPSIVDVHAFGALSDGRVYFVMEFLRGESLGSRLERDRIPFENALAILDDIAKALEVVHERGIIHRDLKPENVFLATVPRETQPTVKLLDFGLAKLRTEDVRMERTGSGVMLGTPLYMSPEQAMGKGVDHRTDIYALGAVAYEILLGRPPFVAESAAEIIAAHIRDEPPKPESLWPECPDMLSRLLASMLAKDPTLRPGLDEVRRMFSFLRGSMGRLAFNNGLPDRPRAWPVALATFLVLTGGIVAVALIFSDAGTRATRPAAMIDAGAGPSLQAPPAQGSWLTDAGGVTITPIVPPIDAGPVPAAKPKKHSTPKRVEPKRVEPKRDPKDETIIVFPRGKP